MQSALQSLVLLMGAATLFISGVMLGLFIAMRRNPEYREWKELGWRRGLYVRVRRIHADQDD